MQECSKCSKPITGKNYRADQGKIVHKICPRESSNVSNVSTKAVKAKSSGAVAKTKTTRAVRTSGETKVGYILELIKSCPTLSFKKLQEDVSKKYGEKTAGASNLRRTLYTVKQKYNVQLTTK